ncbi:MAG: MFS transporter [Steroidobacteraceae bacterium]
MISRVNDANRLQWVITSFLIGNGLGQLLFGPLADRYGRRPVVLGSVTLFGALSLAATAATSLPMLLGTRVVQGFIAAGCGIVPRSIVRDRFLGFHHGARDVEHLHHLPARSHGGPRGGPGAAAGRELARIFAFLALCSLGVMAWMLLRLPETLPPERRRPLNSAHLFNAARFVLTEPSSILYTLAVTAMFGSIIAFVSTVPQIFTESFHRPDLMSLVFALCAGGMGVASFCNTRIVERVGMHRVSHLALVGFVSVTGAARAAGILHPRRARDFRGPAVPHHVRLRAVGVQLRHHRHAADGRDRGQRRLGAGRDLHRRCGADRGPDRPAVVRLRGLPAAGCAGLRPVRVRLRAAGRAPRMFRARSTH